MDQPPQLRALRDFTLSCCDARWDADQALYCQPGGYSGGEGAVAMVRESAHYALALLDHDAAGDRERAARTLAAVLDFQWTAPGQPHHGTFARTPTEPEPGQEGQVWKDFDPNWREFIGLDLELILRLHGEKLDAALQGRIEHALKLAVEGSMDRGLPGHYTNIALMAVFLYDACGKRFGNAEWSTQAERLGGEVWELFCRHRSFHEFNSPTYYGIDLGALAALRRFAHHPELQAQAAEMEQCLWQEMAGYYHAGLRNFCGPYDRAYGMDLGEYVAVVSLWIAPITGLEAAPLPQGEHLLNHGHDLVYGCVVSQLGLPELPEAVRQAFVQWQGPGRELTTVITVGPRRLATAVLRENYMYGGDSAPRRAWVQAHPATAHWRSASGKIAWLNFICEDGMCVEADELGLHISFPDVRPREISALAHLPGAEHEDLRASAALPGLPAHFDPAPEEVQRLEGEADIFQLSWAPLIEVALRFAPGG